MTKNKLVPELSPREGEVLILLARGGSNREIGDHFQLSSKTIDTHRGHVLKKLGLRNNSDITRFALQRGLIQVDETWPPQAAPWA